MSRSFTDPGGNGRKGVTMPLFGDKACSVHHLIDKTQTLPLLPIRVVDRGKGNLVKSYAEAAMDGAVKLVVVSSGVGHTSALQQSDRGKKGRAVVEESVYGDVIMLAGPTCHLKGHPEVL